MLERTSARGFDETMRAVWREGATVHVGYEDPRELAGRYDVDASRQTLEQMAALVETLAAA